VIRTAIAIRASAQVLKLLSSSAGQPSPIKIPNWAVVTPSVETDCWLGPRFTSRVSLVPYSGNFDPHDRCMFRPPKWGIPKIEPNHNKEDLLSKVFFVWNSHSDSARSQYKLQTLLRLNVGFAAEVWVNSKRDYISDLGLSIFYSLFRFSSRSIRLLILRSKVCYFRFLFVFCIAGW